MQDVQMLTLARAKIKDPASHTRGTYARDANGDPTPFDAFGHDDDRMNPAVSWCAVGALKAVAVEHGLSSVMDHLPALDLLNHAAGNRFGMGIVTVNDDRSHAHVLAAFDDAIRDAKTLGR